MDNDLVPARPGTLAAISTLLVVEDDAFIAMDVEGLLTESGYNVLGPFASVTDTLDLLKVHLPDAALLDVRLIDGSAEPIAMALCNASVPFAVMSAAEGKQLGDVLASAPQLAKPFSSDELRDAVQRLLLKPSGAGPILEGSGVDRRRA